MENQMNFMSLLPPNIIGQITSRLPIKSIIRCMCVCKLWHKLISNPYVSKHDVQFMIYHQQSIEFAVLDHDPIENNNPIAPEDQILLKPFSYPDEEEDFEMRRMLGSCNGLICFSASESLGACDEIYMYNPIIGESVKVPQPSDQSYSDFYKFGFCPYSSLYKILRIVFETCKVEIYTLGSGQEWRSIGDAPVRIPSAISPATCARGTLYWLLQEENTHSILTFNLGKEEFGSVPPPKIGDDNKIIYNLGFMEHCLIATAGYNPPLGLEIWVMNKDSSSWSKNWIVDATDCLKSISKFSLQYLEPVKLGSDGKIFMLCMNQELCWYDPKERRLSDFMSINTRAGSSSCFSGLIAYTASLVSPKELMEGGSKSRKRKQEDM